MDFAVALSCIDGRIQRPVNDFLLKEFDVSYLDTVTRAGMVKYLTSSYDPSTTSVVTDLDSSIRAHGPTQLALVAHHDCAGNPIADQDQHRQLRDGVAHFRRRYPELEVVGIWVADGLNVDVFVT
ncbi:MAG TPA: carbonic anhydrase [Acidimicrobiia bacterium]|nr:carbonic anhydrase [Acidimicrobiia bacterium]